jgi:2'-5' RNA ligase
MRLFVALEVPEQVREHLAASQQTVRESVKNNFPAVSADLKWVRPENFHVTLKFIGEASEGEVPGIIDELRRVRAEGLIKAEFRGFGYTWRPPHSGVLCVTMDVSKFLRVLAQQIDRRLQHLGILPQKRDFLPHVTIARFKKDTVLPAARGAVAGNRGKVFAFADWDRFTLIQSELGAGGSKYAVFESFRFAMAAHS